MNPEHHPSSDPSPPPTFLSRGLLPSRAAGYLLLYCTIIIAEPSKLTPNTPCVGFRETSFVWGLLGLFPNVRSWTHGCTKFTENSRCYAAGLFQHYRSTSQTSHANHASMSKSSRCLLGSGSGNAGQKNVAVSFELLVARVSWLPLVAKFIPLVLVNPV